MLLGSLLLSMATAQLPVTDADVYRDPHGVPHVEASTEAAAWYALGYEEARDALLLIQISAKRVRGEAVKYLIDKPGIAAQAGFTLQNRIFTDLLVKVMDTYPTHHTEQQLRDMFKLPITNPNHDPNQNFPFQGATFYDNCVAFAAGVNAYREKVMNATVAGQELTLKQWLTQAPLQIGSQTSTVDLSWVYLDEVRPLDFLWYGRWINALFAANHALHKQGRINSVDMTSTDDSGMTALGEDGAVIENLLTWSDTEVIEAPSAVDALLRFKGMQKMIAGLPGSGSNSFCWTKDYCQETVNNTTVKYSGLMAEPHTGSFASSYAGPGSFLEEILLREPIGVHMWFAHVKVTPAGSSVPSLDAFGTVPHGQASFFTAHNQNLAWGGSQGAPNFSDAFLLRLLEDSTGRYDASLNYYDYYSNGWTALASHSCAIPRGSGSPTAVTYWRAGPFGFVLPDLAKTAEYFQNPSLGSPPLPVVYGEFPATHSERFWRIQKGQAKMRFWGGPEAVTRDPMLATLRVPLDAAVDGQSFHWMFPRDAWEFAHYDTVEQVRDRVNAQAASYFVNFCCVDRSGSLFSTQLGAVPERANIAPGATAPLLYGTTALNVFPDIFHVYSGAIGPVPARMLEDKVFDWKYGSTSGSNGSGYPVPGSLQYLNFSQNGGIHDRNYKAKFEFLEPGNGFPAVSERILIPPMTVAQWWVNNAGFASMSNATPWHASRKESFASEPTPPNPGQYNHTTTDNPLYQAVLDAGTLYQVSAYSEESVDRNQMVIDRLTKIARGYSADAGVRAQAWPPMTVAEAKAFAVDPTLYAPQEYAPDDEALPPAIRNVVEIQTYMGTPGTSTPSNGWPADEADREARFFHDLWEVLTNPNHPAYGYWNTYRAPGQPANLSLKQIWVDNLYQHVVPGQAPPPADTRHVMWYKYPTQQNLGLTWVEMPVGYALIDFQWNESTLGANDSVSYLGAGTGGFDHHVGEFSALVEFLASGTHRMEPSSPHAALYEAWRMRFVGPRTWRRLVNGQPEVASGQPLHVGSSWVHLLYAAFPPLYQGMAAHNVGPVPVGISDDVYSALYYDPQWSIRDGQQANRELSVNHINQLTQFFLELGGFFIKDANIVNNGDPSRKMARYRVIESRVQANPLLDPRKEMLDSYPGVYPLTANLARMAVARKLIEAGSDLGGSLGAPSRRMDEFFRTRLCDYAGNVAWPPAPATSAPCYGGQLTEVAWWLDPRRSNPFSFKDFVRIGSANHPLLTLFPDDPGMPPRSFYWANPGIPLMRPQDPSFVSLAPHLANNDLAESYYPPSRYRLPSYYVETHVYIP